MIRTKMTELFGIEHPIMLAGMNWVTEPRLISAVCNAGGLGILATTRCTPEETRRYIREIRARTDKPFGINQALLAVNSEYNIGVAVEEKVPVINYSLGKPSFIEQVHEYGGKVLATVALAKHAVKAAQLGCDALVVTGHESAAHGASATSLVLIPIVASRVNIPLIAAGGFFDGRGLAAALALGADGICMGTRLMITKESVVHDNYKRLILQATEQDTLYSDRFDGMDGRVLKTSVTEALLKGGFPLVDALKGAREVKQMLKLSFWQFIRMSSEMMRHEEGWSLWAQARFSAANRRTIKAVHDGNLEEGLLYAGQDCGGIDDIPTVQEVIDRIVLGAKETAEATVGKMTLDA